MAASTICSSVGVGCASWPGGKIPHRDSLASLFRRSKLSRRARGWRFPRSHLRTDLHILLYVKQQASHVSQKVDKKKSRETLATQRKLRDVELGSQQGWRISEFCARRFQHTCFYPASPYYFLGSFFTHRAVAADELGPLAVLRAALKMSLKNVPAHIWRPQAGHRLGRP